MLTFSSALFVFLSCCLENLTQQPLKYMLVYHTSDLSYLRHKQHPLKRIRLISYIRLTIVYFLRKSDYLWKNFTYARLMRNGSLNEVIYLLRHTCWSTQSYKCLGYLWYTESRWKSLKFGKFLLLFGFYIRYFRLKNGVIFFFVCSKIKPSKYLWMVKPDLQVGHHMISV